MVSSHKSKLAELIDSNDLPQFLNEVSNLIDENEQYHTIDSVNEINNFRDNNLSIFHLNIRSLNKHSTELVSLLSELKLTFDCISLTEVNSTNLNSYNSLLPGYVFHPVPPQHGNAGGIGLLVKEELKFEELKPYNLNCTDPCENLWVKLTKNNKESILGIIYRHPNRNIEDFNSELEQTLQTMQNTKHDRCAFKPVLSPKRAWPPL